MTRCGLIVAAVALVLGGCFPPDPATVADESGRIWRVMRCRRGDAAACVREAHYWCPDGFDTRGDVDPLDAAKDGELLVRCEGHGRFND